MKSADVAAPNAYRLLWAGFMAIMASGVGFSIRAGILGQWAEQYGFTQTELGAITGGGLTGFGIIILLSALIADKIGYGKLMVTAFVMHLASAAPDAGDGPGVRLGRQAGGVPVPVLGDVPLRRRQRDRRGGRQPAGRDPLPEEADPLPEHPPRRLAGRPDRGRPALDRLHRRGHLRLEAAGQGAPLAIPDLVLPRPGGRSTG